MSDNLSDNQSNNPGGNQTKLGMAPNVAGLLCNVPCCIGFIFSIVAVVVEKENRFVKFHAFQSLLLHAAGFVIGFGLQVLTAVAATVLGPLAGLIGMLGLPFGLAFLGVQIFMMIKANGNEEFKLPIIGDPAKQWAQ